MRKGPIPNLLPLALMLLAGLPARAAPPAPERWACTLADGVPRVVASDLARAYPDATERCRPLPVPQPAASASAAPPRRAPRGPIVAPRKRAPAAAPLAGLTPDLAAAVDRYSARSRLDPLLVGALVSVESAWRVDARSSKGALGLMQLMPETARRYGVDGGTALLDPGLNLDVGTRHLGMLQARYGERLDLVLAAYNAGEGAVQRHGERVPPYAETQAYVNDVLQRWRQLQRQLPPPPGAQAAHSSPGSRR